MKWVKDWTVSFMQSASVRVSSDRTVTLTIPADDFVPVRTALIEKAERMKKLNTAIMSPHRHHVAA